MTWWRIRLSSDFLWRLSRCTWHVSSFGERAHTGSAQQSKACISLPRKCQTKSLVKRTDSCKLPPRFHQMIKFVYPTCVGVTLCGRRARIFKNNRAQIREEACCLPARKSCAQCTSVEKRRRAHATHGKCSFGQHLSLLCFPVITHWLAVSHYSELEHDLFVRFYWDISTQGRAI